MDELFTFIGCKKNPIRIWTAVNRREREFAGIYVGDGSVHSLKKFLKGLRKKYRVHTVCTDGNYCYEKYVKKAFKGVKHFITKAETSLVESYNKVLRHYLARLTRKTLCYSKSVQMLKYSVLLLVQKFNARFLESQEEEQTISRNA